jgi:HSP20 family protein
MRFRPWLHGSIRIEEYALDGSWVVRAQLPGVDAERDLRVMVADHEVTIEVRRPIRLPDPLDSEFDYTPVRRTVLLPPRAKDETLRATYGTDGILELTVDTVRPVPIGRTVPIQLR